MKIGIIGCGNMGSAIARRLAAKYSLALYDHNSKWIQELAKATDAKPCKDVADLVRSSDILFLAIKPQSFPSAADELLPLLKSNSLLISILSGIRLATLQQKLGDIPILRMMPNLAIEYGKGVLGLATNRILSRKLKKEVESICKLLGKEAWLTEDQIDALTSLTGSGPAFMFILIDAMIDSAIAMGFSADQGKDLIMQMIKGSLTILEETDKHPAELKNLISSPAGTTIAGIKALEDHGVRKGIINTFLAAYHRAQELAK